MSNSKRRARRVLPAYDPDNDIGAVDRIRFAMIHNQMEDLTEPEHEQFKRWKQIDDWIRDRRYVQPGRNGPEINVIPNKRFLRNLIMTKFEVTWDTAERDIRNTQKLFTASTDDQEYKRSVYIEQVEEKADQAAMRGDLKAYEKLMTLAARLTGLFDEPVPEDDYDKMENIQFFIEYNPEAVGLKTIDNKEEIYERWMAKGRSVSEVMAKEAEDVKYEP